MLTYIYCSSPIKLSILALLFAILFRIWHVRQHSQYYRFLLYLLSAVSVAVVIYVTALSREQTTASSFQPLLYQIINGAVNGEYARTLFMNALLFFPLGFFLCLALSGILKPWLAGAITVVFSFALSFGIEYAQYYYCLGVPEADDILMNTIGGGIGALIAAVPPYFIFRWIIALRESVG